MGTGNGRDGRVGSTAGSHDAGFKGGTSSQHSIGDNLSALKSHYQNREGYFGKARTPSDTKTRKLKCDDPDGAAKDFYDKAAKGGIEVALDNGKGVKASMRDGTVVTFRPSSDSDGSPAVTLNARKSRDHEGLKPYQKIHFEQEGD